MKLKQVNWKLEVRKLENKPEIGTAILQRRDDRELRTGRSRAMPQWRDDCDSSIVNGDGKNPIEQWREVGQCRNGETTG